MYLLVFNIPQPATSNHSLREVQTLEQELRGLRLSYEAMGSAVPSRIKELG